MGFIFPYKSKIIQRNFITDKIIKVSIEKPLGYDCKSGQMIDLSIDNPGFGLEVESYTIIGDPKETYFEILVKQHIRQDKISTKLTTDPGSFNLVFSSPWFPLQYKGPGIFIVEDTYTPQVIYMLNEKLSLINHKFFFIIEDEACNLFTKEIKDTIGKKTEVLFCRCISETLSHNLIQKQIKTNKNRIHVYGSYGFRQTIMENIKNQTNQKYEQVE